MKSFAADRWEHGSEFHWLTYTIASDVPAPWHHSARFCGSGRDAIQMLIQHGRANRSWQRLWVPSYFCQEVVAYLYETGIRLETYPSSPTNIITTAMDDLDWHDGDVLLSINYFGLWARPEYQHVPDWVEIVEDHTHDPWSPWARESRANWCVASLRKTIPLGSGGVIWSPMGRSLPDALPLTPERHTAALEKLAAMLLKAAYLSGQPIEKSAFRDLQLSGERGIASGTASGISPWAEALLPTFPITSWRRRRRRNFQVLIEALVTTPWVRVLRPQTSYDLCPFAGILLFDEAQRRDLVREQLIAAGVYPAVLWSLEEPILRGIPDANLDFSRRMLVIHCDMRYSAADMGKVASLIQRIGASFDN